MLCLGDEWVTSELKWITAAILWYIKVYSVMGDELTSSVKILFFFLWKYAIRLEGCYASVDPSLCLRFRSVLNPFQVRSKSVSGPFLRMGGKWDLLGIYLGLTWESVLWLALACWASAKKAFVSFVPFVFEKEKETDVSDVSDLLACARD